LDFNKGILKVSDFPFIYLFHTQSHNACLCHSYIADSHVYNLHIINDMSLGDADTAYISVVMCIACSTKIRLFA